MNHRLLPFVVLSALLSSITISHAAEVRVMTFNLWQGGEAGGQPLERSIEAIQLAKADIVGLQETHGRDVAGKQIDNGKKIAEAMGWHYLDQGGRTGILSRFPILAGTRRKWGARIEFAPGCELTFFNVHFPHAPYQPYQLLGIPYADAPFLENESQAVHAAEQARGSELSGLLDELRPVIENGSPVILTGDFNEPSHLDWTPRAAEAKKCPMKVEFPTTRRLSDAGMIDAWRHIYPDEVAVPGLTWTTTTSPTDPKDHHDRIDFIFVSRQGVAIKEIKRVGEVGECDLYLDSWPSDHRAVVASITLEEAIRPSSR